MLINKSTGNFSLHVEELGKNELSWFKEYEVGQNRSAKPRCTQDRDGQIRRRAAAVPRRRRLWTHTVMVGAGATISCFRCRYFETGGEGHTPDLHKLPEPSVDFILLLR